MNLRLTSTSKIYIVLETPEGRNKRAWVHGVYSFRPYAVAKAEKLKTGKTKFGKVGYISILTKSIRGEKAIDVTFKDEKVVRHLTDRISIPVGFCSIK